MSADAHAEVLAELGQGDEIAVAERLKREAVDLAALLRDLPGDDRALTDERVVELLDGTNERTEAVLAIAFPVAEYGRETALAALPPALRHIAAATAAVRTDQTQRAIAAVPVVGRLVWATTAFALSCDRLDSLVALARARVQVPFSDEVQPVVALTALRYPDALGGNAGNAFRNYDEWLHGRSLLERYPLFEGDLDAALLEADLLLAMESGRFRQRIYARGHTRDTVRRLRARVSDPAQRAALDALFPGPQTLEERLEAAYAAVEGDRNRFETGPQLLLSDQ